MNFDKIIITPEIEAHLKKVLARPHKMTTAEIVEAAYQYWRGPQIEAMRAGGDVYFENNRRWFDNHHAEHIEKFTPVVTAWLKKEGITL